MMTTIVLMILAFAMGGYLMRWWLWGSCQIAYNLEDRAIYQCLEAMDESCQLRDRLARVQQEADESWAYAYRLLEDRDFYESEREYFKAAYVPSAPPSDFYTNFDRN